MTLPVASALRRRDRLWPAALASALLHAVLITWALVRQQPPPIDLEQKPIMAKLVRLGEKRPEQFLPRKEAAPPPAPAAPPPTAPVVAAAAPRPAPAAPAAKAPAKPPPPSPASASHGRPGGTTLASVLSKVQRDDEKRWGDPDGDAAGDAEEGSAGDRYLALVASSLHAAYVLPPTISDRERMYLKATVVLFIEVNGRIADYRFESRSGNDSYDSALERAIKVARLPPPPPELRERFRRGGLGVKFHF